jgi:hypothetical protein
MLKLMVQLLLMLWHHVQFKIDGLNSHLVHIWVRADEVEEEKRRDDDTTATDQAPHFLVP